jgi:iron complex outermembrane receptor protein
LNEVSELPFALFDKHYYSACLARGDCFFGSTRNVFGTLTYRY